MWHVSWRTILQILVILLLLFVSDLRAIGHCTCRLLHRVDRPTDASCIKGGNLHSKFGHDRPSGSQVIRYVRDGRTHRRTDRQTDRRTDRRTKNKAYCPFPTGGAAVAYGNKNKQQKRSISRFVTAYSAIKFSTIITSSYH